MCTSIHAWFCITHDFRSCPPLSLQTVNFILFTLMAQFSCHHHLYYHVQLLCLEEKTCFLRGNHNIHDSTINLACKGLIKDLWQDHRLKYRSMAWVLVKPKLWNIIQRFSLAGFEKDPSRSLIPSLTFLNGIKCVLLDTSNYLATS
jgi:hypothetical protein